MRTFFRTISAFSFLALPAIATNLDLDDLHSQGWWPTSLSCKTTRKTENLGFYVVDLLDQLSCVNDDTQATHRIDIGGFGPALRMGSNTKIVLKCSTANYAGSYGGVKLAAGFIGGLQVAYFQKGLTEICILGGVEFSVGASAIGAKLDIWNSDTDR